MRRISLTTDLGNAVAPAKRGRGRPKGSLTRLGAPGLNFTHFAFLRGLMEGMGLWEAWDRFLAHEEGIGDVRSVARRVRELVRQVQKAGEARGLQDYVQTAFAGFEIPKPPPLPARKENAPEADQAPPPPPAPPANEPPPLEVFIEDYCLRSGSDRDFFSEREWLELYEDAFGNTTEATPSPALLATPEGPQEPAVRLPATAGESPTDKATPEQERLSVRIGALNVLASELENPPQLSHRLDAWLSASLARSLAGTQFRGRPLPLLTIGDLITFVNMQHHRWYTAVPRLGPERAKRVLQWLRPLAERLERPLYEIALKPLKDHRAQRERTLALIDAGSVKQFGIVPLDRLAVPPKLDGRHGQFRGLAVNTLGARTDLEAIQAWLRLKSRNARTLDSYTRIVERFYLWALVERRKALSDLDQGDLLDFGKFASKPPAHWVQTRKVDRGSSEWRPFRGPLAGSSLHLNMSVIGGLMASLSSSGYLAMNAASDVARSLPVSRARLDIDRTFDDGQWAWLMRFWQEAFDKTQAPSPPRAKSTDPKERGRWARAASLRRTRLVLDLCATTGLRLQELLTTRHGALQRTVVDGQAVWLLKVIGKGSREREVLLFDDVVERMRAHLQDRRDAGVHRAAARRGFRTLHDWDQAPSPTPQAEDALQPLVGILRPPPGGSGADTQGVPIAADAFGSLDPTALHQSLKRFLAAAAKAAESSTTKVEIDTARLRRASAHWLRHFFANSMASSEVSPAAMKAAMGHSSLATTSIYLRQDRKLLVAEMGKLRRKT